jgi:TonB family protein
MRAMGLPQENPVPEKDELKRALGYSVALHVAMFLIFAVRAFLNPSPAIDIESAIRVDIVAMPDKVAQLPPMPVEAPAPKPEKLEPKPEAKTEPEKPKLPKAAAVPPKPDNTKINLNKTKRDQEAALKRLEALEKMKNSMKEPPAETKPETKVAPAQKPAQVKGNVVSHGASLKGIAKLDYQNYNDAIHEHIHKFWNLPQWMANANLSAVVLVFVDAQGHIIKKSVIRSSGRPEFDERALKAIESASPLPHPPSELVDVLSVEGMQIEMSPD